MDDRTYKVDSSNPPLRLEILVLIGGFFISCARPGDIKIKMPAINSSQKQTQEKSSCEVDVDRLKEDIGKCREDLFDAKYANACWEPDYE